MSEENAKHEPFAFDSLHDSGQREEFSTGAVRDTVIGKGRYDLLSPRALRRLAVHMQNGARKYATRNWEKGMPLSRFFDSAVRHLYTWLEQALEKTPRAEDHLAAALWNIHCLIHTEERIAEGKLPAELGDMDGVGG